MDISILGTRLLSLMYKALAFVSLHMAFYGDYGITEHTLSICYSDIIILKPHINGQYKLS